jgi:hypothetical protein
MHDDPLPGDEQARFDALPREKEAPPRLEERVVRELHTRGTLRRPPQRRGWLQVAAAVLLIASGFAAGRLTASAAPMTTDGSRFLLLLYGAQSATASEEAARVAEYGSWAKVEGAAGRLLSGDKLGDRATVVGDARGLGSVNLKEPSGLFMVRAASFEEAVTIAQRCPHIKHGGAVLVRPIE